MKNDDKIRDEILQYDINRETAKILPLSSGKIDKYECLTAQDIIPPHQRRVIKQAKSAYFPSGKTFEKEKEIMEEQGKNKLKPQKF